MKWNFICESDAKPAKNFKGEVIGTIEKRALYYDKNIGRKRVYRRDFDEESKNWKILKFRTEEEAKSMCDEINEAYNDDFKVGVLN